jgi:hypothetical protein
LTESVDRLSLEEVEGKAYAQRYPIRRFSTLLERADSLGDVVLVTDTKDWSERMVDAVRRSVMSPSREGRRTRLVLQSYGEQDIEAVKRLALEIGGEVILTLYMTGADDLQVETLAKRYGVVAVVADARRFSPWLAERLHATNTPILVHTINDHREILRLTQAGADGFYTDEYRPYESAASDTVQAAACAPPGELPQPFFEWTERDVLRPGDYALATCATRTAAGIELVACDAAPAITGVHLSVPPKQTAHVDLDVEAGPPGASFWLEMVQKNRATPALPRRALALGANERRAFAFDMELPEGSPGIVARLGLATPEMRLTIRAFRLSHASSKHGTQTGQPPAELPSARGLP